MTVMAGLPFEVDTEEKSRDDTANSLYPKERRHCELDACLDLVSSFPTAGKLTV